MLEQVEGPVVAQLAEGPVVYSVLATDFQGLSCKVVRGLPVQQMVLRQQPISSVVVVVVEGIMVVEVEPMG
mgnify:CR=1 FL=1